MPVRQILFILAGIALIAIIGFGGFRLYNSAWLTIQQVDVQGAGAIDEQSVLDAAGLAGQRLLAADTTAAASRVKTLARVKDAQVTRHFPHSATIRVTERTPTGVWRIGATNYLVDDDGYVIDTADSAGDLPVVDATLAGATLQVGDRVDADALWVARKVTQSSPSARGQSVVRFTYEKQTGLTAITESGTQVRLGDGQALDYKLAVWQQVAMQVNPADLHELDLRYGDRPFYR